MFFADAVTDLAEFVVGALVGNIFMIICKAGGIKNQVAVNMFFICMRSKHIFIFSLQNRICDFGADLMGKFGIGEVIGMIGDDHVPGKVIPLFHDIIFSHFCCHGKFQIRSFRRTAKRRDEFLFIRLIWIRDIGHSLFHCRFDWKDLNVSHIFFTISFSSSISCGVAVPTVFATLASWLMFTPILCIS